MFVMKALTSVRHRGLAGKLLLEVEAEASRQVVERQFRQRISEQYDLW